MYRKFEKMSKTEEAIRTMDRLGGRGEAFVFLIDFEMADPVVLTPDRAAGSGIFFDFNRRNNISGDLPAIKPFSFGKKPVSFEEYEIAYDLVRAELNRGNTYLLNLTFPTPVETDLRLEEIFQMSRAKYRILFQDRFVCFSPEIFVRIDSGGILWYGMKGTIDAGIPDAERILMEDPKEIAEHTTIVDLIRNDLNMVARSVRVEEFRYVDRITTNSRDLLQTSSRITGRLRADYRSRIGSILFSLLPAGSVTGAPKKKTVEIIRSVEPVPRGFFTGVAGFFDGERLDSGVMIRFIENTDKGLVYRSGGGITVQSDPEAEYREMIDKVYVP